MIERRNLVGGGIAAGLTALVGGAEAEAAAAQSDSAGGVMVAQAVERVREAINAGYTRPWGRIQQIREQQRLWLRANHRYPEYIEVGLDVWDGLHDWHVHFQQPISMTRATDGRYMMSFMFTTFILRPDVSPDYLGPPFDNASERGPARQ